MDYLQPVTSPRQNKDMTRSVVHNNHRPRIADGEDANSSSYSELTDDDTSDNPPVNMREPFDQPVAVPLQDISSSSFTVTMREPSGLLNPHPLTPFEANEVADRTANAVLQTQHQSSESDVDRCPSPPMSVFPCKQPRQQSRYYAQALSAEGKLALVRGKGNDNPQHLLGESANACHDVPIDLAQRRMPEVERTNAPAVIEYHKHYGQGTLSKLKEKVRKVFGSSRARTKVASIDTEKDEKSTYSESQRISSHSTCNLHSSTLSLPEPHSLSKSRSTPSFQEFVDSAPRYHGSHARAASSENYFPQPPNPRMSTYSAHCTSFLVPISGPPSSSGTSTRARSPLHQEVKFRANPETTFDSFLVPHKSGKGEVLKDSKHALKVKTPKASPDPSPKLSAKTTRLSKMPSIQFLLGRGSGSESG